MKKFFVLASALIFAASVTFGQTQKPAEKKDQQKPATTTTTTTTTTSTVKQEPAKPAAAPAAQGTATKEEKTHVAIEVKDLPKAAQDYITKTYAGKKVDQAVRLTDTKGTVTYKATIGDVILHFDYAGKFLGESKKEAKPTTETKPAQPAPAPEKKKEPAPAAAPAQPAKK